MHLRLVLQDMFYDQCCACATLLLPLAPIPLTFTPVVHVTKVRPLADRVREVQQQMSAALLTSGDDASCGGQEGEAAAGGSDGGSKRSREHAGGGQ